MTTFEGLKQYSAARQRAVERGDLAGLADFEGRTEFDESNRVVIFVGQSIASLRGLIGQRIHSSFAPIGSGLAKTDIERGVVSVETIIDQVSNLRLRQVERRAPERAEDLAMDIGATFMKAQGVFEGEKEPSVAVEIFHFNWFPGEETFPKFKRSLTGFGEMLALVLAQKEIFVRFSQEGKETVTSVTPLGAPPSGARWDALIEKMAGV